jgi:hypothetical protein
MNRQPLLSKLPPNAQQAFMQEMLDQGALFRQISAAANGVPGPIQRNIIPDMEFEEEINAEDIAQEDPPTPEPTPEPAPQPAPAPAPTPEPRPPCKPGLSKEEAQEMLDAEGKRFKKLMAGGAAAVLTSMLLGAGALQWFSPPDTPPEPPVNPPVVDGGGGQASTTVVTTDEQLIAILGRSGFGIPSTDLSETADHVYNYDPELRDRHLQELHETFDRDP